MLLSTLLAGVPVIVLLGAIGIFEIRAHIAAMLGLATALAIAVFAFGMPAGMAGMSAVYGAGFGLMPIGWIILNVIFLYQLTNEKGEFDVLRHSIRGISDDRRMQVLFIAFCFGAFFEGAAGFGTPVAVTAAMLMGLGFSPLSAAGLCLIANTAPVAFGALGTPVIALSAVTGLDLLELSGMIGRQLPFFSVIVPFWLIWAFVGFRRMLEVWPALLVAGASFALPQYLVSNFHGPWLVDIVAAIVSMVSLALLPAGVAPEEADDRGAARLVVGGRGRGGGARASGRRHLPRRGAEGLDALGDPQRLRLHLGRAAGQGLPRLDLEREAPGRRPARDGDEGAPRGRRAACRGRDLQLQHPVDDRHRHPARRHRLGPPARLLARRAWCGCTARRST